MNMGKTKIMVGVLDLDLLKREIWKGSLRRLSERSREQCNLIMWWLLALNTQEMQ